MRRMILIAALVTCAVVAWAGKGGGGKPPKGDADFTVAYKDNSIAGRAWVMTADADTRQALTAFDVWSATNWTPDGTALLVTAEIDGAGIYTIDLATKARTKVIPVHYVRNSPDWSVADTPNGSEMIVFADDVAGGSGQAVFVAMTDGTDVTQLTTTETGRIWDHPRFHPAGNQIAVSTGGVAGSDARGVVLLDLDIDVSGVLVVTGTTNLTNVEGSPLQGVGGRGAGFQFSNDGSLGVLSDGSDIWLVDLSDPAHPTNLTQGGGGAKPLYPCFDATDGKIYFISFVANKQGGGSWRMFRMNIDGSDIEQITNQKAGTTHGVSCRRG